MTLTKKKAEISTLIHNSRAIMSVEQILEAKYTDLVFLTNKAKHSLLTKYEKRRLEDLNHDRKLISYIGTHKHEQA